MARKKGMGEPLEAYLRRSGLPLEATLVAPAGSDAKARVKLVNSLHREKKQLPISRENEEMKQLLMLLFGNAMDLILREHRFGPAETPALVVCLNGVADRDLAERGLAELASCRSLAPEQPEELLQWLATVRSSIPEAKVETRLDQMLSSLMLGHTIVLLQGAAAALDLTTPGIPHRPVKEPFTEGVVRGPREGFTEALLVNTALLRRRLKDERLRMDGLTIGERTATRVVVTYLEGLCRPELVAEVHKRLGRIKIDGILDTTYLEEFIEDTTWTVFPLSNSTERPDAVAAALLEGRVAVMTDGSPFVLCVPVAFNDLMQSSEDYYERFPIILLVRVLRWLFAAIALLGPAFYVAFTTFHHEMLPYQLLVSILSAREGVPFPAVVEALIMEIAFEALREAGIRMPKQIGQAISIVGALVIGQAAVQAGIVSAPMVIVVSLTGLASFVVPKFGAAISLRLLRFVMLFVAGTFGAYGLTLGVVCVLVHLLSLRSFGAPYYSPMAPLIADDLDDAMLRAPVWMNRKRPTLAEPLDRQRTPPGLGPNKFVPTKEEQP
ncbi:MAG TPA: spore germination protein [Symbiobacteriaceae bacterium]|nr:spore germination protein [Symbiobacteriaceae bacterium]